MNQAEAERVQKSFDSLFAIFGKGGGEAKNTKTTTTTTTARTPIKEEDGRMQKSFDSLFAIFGKGGGEAKNTKTTTPTKEEDGGMDTLKILTGVLSAIKMILLMINPSEDQPLVFLVKGLEQGLNEHGRHIFM